MANQNRNAVLPALITLTVIIELLLHIFYIVERTLTVGIETNSLSWLILSSFLIHVFAYLNVLVGVLAVPARDLVFRYLVLYLILFVWDFILFVVLRLFTTTFDGTATGIIIVWLLVQLLMIVLLSILVNNREYFLMARAESANPFDMTGLVVQLAVYIIFGVASLYAILLGILPSGSVVIFFLLALWNLTALLSWSWVLVIARVRLSQAYYSGVGWGLLIDGIVGFIVVAVQVVAVILSFFDGLLPGLTSFWRFILLLSTFFTGAKSVAALWLRGVISEVTADESNPDDRKNK